MKKSLLAITVFALLVYYQFSRKAPVELPPPPPPAKMTAPPAPERVVAPNQRSVPPPVPTVEPPATPVVQEKSSRTFRYKIHNGMFIVQGDIVAGAVIQGQTPPEDGLVELEPIALWPNVIPYHIQPQVPNPERIEQAIRMFDGTAVQFVRHTTEDHALVFEAGEKLCLSYVGKVVSKQQIWISPRCAPDDIAHEIMHALGFVHEQNRTDRDNHIDVHFDNIEEEYALNFEKLPPEFTKLSQLGEFDYSSLMMYPPTMFAKGGRITMEPKQRDRMISPGNQLSAGDLARINRAYGR